MRKKLMILLSAAMLFNSLAGLIGYAETTVDPVNVVETEDENIKRETGTATVAAAANTWWMGEDAATANATASGYIAEARNTTGFTKVKEEFCGYVLKMSTSSAESYVILQDPDGAYFKNLTFYIFHRGMSGEERCNISVSDTLGGPFTDVTVGITMEEVGKIENKSTKKVWKQTVAAIDAKYVKITAPVLDNPPGGTYPVLGAFSYDWLKITDLSQLPDGTNKVCGSLNPYWMADDSSEILKNFVEYTVSASAVKASNSVTADNIANDKNIVGNPVNEGDICFVGISGDGKYALLEAPANSFIRRFKYYIYSVGGDTSGIAEALSVSNERNGTYSPVTVIIKKLGYVSGKATNHFLYEVETAGTINCKYVKLTIPTTGWPKIGAFEYDYKINKVGMALDKVFYSLDDILNGQNRMHVESDLNLFRDIEVDGKTYEIEWSSSDENIVKSDGTVDQPAESKAVTVKATVNDDSGAEVYSKNYEITVAAIGSTLVFKEDFEAAVIDGTTGISSVNGYNGWTSTNTEKTQSGILADPANSSNKALWVYREDITPTGDNNEKEYDTISGGKVELSFKHMTTAATTQSRFGWCGMDLYMRAAGIFGYAGGTSISFVNQKKVTWKIGVWHEYRFVIDIDRGILDVYFDGEPVLRDNVLPPASYKSSSISFKTKRGSNFGASYYDDICIRNLTPPTDEAVKYDAQLIELPESTVNDIDLITNGAFDTMIAWQSSDTDVIDNNGIVTQPAEDTEVTLHATVALGEYTEERDIAVTVLGTDNTDYVERNAEALDGIADRFSLSKMLGDQDALNITDNITLPTEYTDGDAGRLGGCKISWSSDSDALTSDGIVRRGENDTRVTLTAKFSFKEDSDIQTERTYTFIVSGNGDYAYHNSFDTAAFGTSASELDGVSADKTEGSGVFYGAWQAPDDLLNGVLGVTRSFTKGVHSAAVLQTDFSAKSAEFGISFYMPSATDRIDVSLGGIDLDAYVTSSAISVGGNVYEATVATKEWHKLVIGFDDYNKWYYLYLDGVAVTDERLVYKTDLAINTVAVSNDSTNGFVGAWYADNVYIKDTTVTDEEAIRSTIEAIDISETAEWNIELPTIGKHGALISWTSEDDSVLDGNGVVTRTVGDDKTITLVATVSRGETEVQETFDVLVPGLDGTEKPTQEKFDEHVRAIDISELTNEKYTEITQDLTLFSEYIKGNCAFYGGMDVTWSSEFAKIISDDGKVTRPVFDRGVTLTATFTSKRDESVTAQKEFDFIVLAPGERLVYEDFEDITEDMVGTSIHEYKAWELEQQIAVAQGQKADLEIDPADTGKPFDEANKAFRINRYRVATGTEVLPERARWYPDADEKRSMLNADAVVLSFNIKFINTASSRFDIAFGGFDGNIFSNKISGTVSGSYANGPLGKGEWHTMTFIFCPTNEVCYFLIDGRLGTTTPYYGFTNRLDVASLEMHTFRKAGLSDFYIDDISMRILGEADATAVTEAAAELSVPENITDTYELPSFGADRTNISWTSENHDIIFDNGKIVGTGTTLLTAIIKRGTEMTTKEFNVNVTKTDKYDFTVNNLIVSDEIINGANVSYAGDTTDAELIVLVYDKDKLVAMRNADISGATVTFDAIDVSEFYECEVKAYIKRNSDIISNVAVLNLK